MKTVAYFSAEFAVHERLYVYSGGLGVLAGDFLKSASDLGLPMIGIGLFYRDGYLAQRIDESGLQAEAQPAPHDATLLKPVMAPSGGRLALRLPEGTLPLVFQAWEVAVGKSKLYLLDADHPSNSPELKAITNRLYAGDRHMRLSQELLLGWGGFALIRELGLPVDIYHANEGHSAFLFLALLEEHLVAGKDLDSAIEAVRAVSLFTTHTPLEAGHDVFEESHVRPMVQSVAARTGVATEELMSLARHPGGAGWNMAAFAIRMSRETNAVSRRHGQVARSMWRGMWPGKAEHDVPIRHVTNGVHLPTWTCPAMAQFYDATLGPEWRGEGEDDPFLWARLGGVDQALLWQARLEAKAELFKRLRQGKGVIGGGGLDEKALTIGFARRFAAYKRPTLILWDRARIKKFLFNTDHPAQIIFAGKAHPADEPGKTLVAEVVAAARSPEFGGRVAFIENYDPSMARLLVSGADVWLNNPVPPLEACGTSGQKAGANGVLNLSALDGWWEEAYDARNGWAFGVPGGREGSDQDRWDAEELYGLLEAEVAPLFYERGIDGVPRGWVERVRESIISVASRFCGRRMIRDYAAFLYEPPAVIAAPTARTQASVPAA